MHIVLSRKGFDGTAGGCPSPIFPDGSMLSLPIPLKTSPLCYSQILSDVCNVAQVIADLTNHRVPPDFRAHLDPDLRRDSLPRLPGWRPLFGQCEAAQGHLRNCGVGEGDLFLFFGVFRKVLRLSDRIIFDRAAAPVHVIWGWLQVEKMVRLDGAASLPSWAQYHPHHTLREKTNNTIYIAASRLTLPGVADPGLPGAGVFARFSSSLQLTEPGAMRHGHWRLPGWMFPSAGKPPLSAHSKPWRWSQNAGGALLQAVDRGQEFVLDADHYPQSLPWAAELIRGNSKQHGEAAW